MFLCFIILSSSWLVFIRQMPFTLVGLNIFLRTFLSKTISLLVIVSFSVHVSHAYVNTGLITERCFGLTYLFQQTPYLNNFKSSMSHIYCRMTALGKTAIKRVKSKSCGILTLTFMTNICEFGYPFARTEIDCVNFFLFPIHNS